MTVSVVIPAFNGERSLSSVISSVLRQIPPPAEVVVVDDGSTDATASLAARFPNVRVLRQQNLGPSAARNAGAATTAGDLILFLDADDVLEDGALATLVGSLERHPMADAALINHRNVDGRTGWEPSGAARLLGRRDVRSLMLNHQVTSNSLVRRRAFARFDEGLWAAEDLELWIRQLLEGGTLVVGGPPLVRRAPGELDSLTSRIERMRVGRRAAFTLLWGRRDLRPTERLVVGYQLVRTSVGLAAARLRVRGRRRRTPITSCVHVFLEDGAGGPEHVRLLLSELSGRLASRTVGLDPTVSMRSPTRVGRSIISVWRSSCGHDVIHAHGVRAAALALPAALLRRSPLVITVHGLHSLRRAPTTVTRWANRSILRRAARVLVLTPSDEAAMRGMIPLYRVARIRAAFAAPSVVDRDEARRRFAIPEDAVAVAWVGRLSPQKDPMTFVRAMLSPSLAGMIGVLAGDGPLRPEIEQAAAGSRLRVMGWADEVGWILAAADLFVSTSRWEGLPLAVLEAASVGLPLVLTDVPGNHDLVEMGLPATLVPPGDVRGLADAIASLIGDAARRRSMGREGAELVGRSFTPEALADDVLAAYRALH